MTRFVPMRLLPRRYNTEMVLRALYERYKGQNLDTALQQSGMGERDSKTLFDVVDQTYGAKIFSRDDAQMERALDDACDFIAAALRDRNQQPQ